MSYKLTSNTTANLDQSRTASKALPRLPTVIEEAIEASIAARFERIVETYPDRLAIKDRDYALTYTQLNQAANRLARAIIAQRGSATEPVALLFDHGVDVVIAILGVLKAGKFYVALDPAYPTDRLKFILEDSRAGMILTNSLRLETSEKLATSRQPVVNFDDVDQSCCPENLGLSQSPTDLAMVTYTSGTTGTPKGSTREQGTLLKRRRMKVRDTPIDTSDRLSLIHSVAFGSASNCLFQSLLNGASLFPFNVKKESINRMARWLEEEQITILHSSPSVFRQLCENLSAQKRHLSLRLIQLSGASIRKNDFDLYKQCFPLTTFLEIHMGSTETGAIARATVNHSFSFPEEGVPVGYPATGKTILLVDENGQEVRPGEIGEIAVKSRLLHQGYWNNPELTRAKYVSDPNRGDERTFFTGDLARMLPDGFFIHLGRKDHQVKIRGYRVELGEIESTLLSHPLVKEAAATAWDHEHGEEYLAAYVVPRANAALTIEDLREFVSAKLPTFMVPAFFMILDYLPFMNGKVDRNDLPRPDHQRPHLQNAYMPSQSHLEVALVQIWQEALHVQPIGIHDKFLDLGGDSLVAARVVSAILKNFKFDMAVKLLFESPTIADMAKLLDDDLQKQTVSQDLELLTEIERLSDAQAEYQLSESDRDKD